jgi:replicative DNA helicase
VNLLIAKQRNGELASLPLIFNAPVQRFEEPTGQRFGSDED